MVDLVNRVYVTVWTRLRREEGQTAVEYAVIVAVIALGLITSLAFFKNDIADAFSAIADKLSAAI